MNFSPGQIIQISKDDGRLIPGRVLWTYDCYVAAEFESAKIEGSEEQQLSLFYEQDRKFVQQPTQLEGVLQRSAADSPTHDEIREMDLDTCAGRAVVVFELLGTPSIADNRGCYRVRAASYGINVVFADRDDCELMDVSHTGFALLSEQQFAAGDVVRACLPEDSGAVCGHVRIQSARQLRDGRYRYGVVCLGKATETACARLATELQRQQLLRHAGLA